MAQQKEKGLTARKSDFSEWYTQTIQKAELADYSAVKGCMIIRPAGYALWEAIQNYFNKRLKAINVKNAYFPLFIPETFFKREAQHAKGFKPEVAWISNVEGERLALRPTSETVMYESYAKWIRSWRDLPLRMNQWANIIRWETKATRLFLRTREFLWQEGHCAYETEQECNKETLLILKEYEKLCREQLAIPVLTGKKTETEKFAGASYTLSVEALMPDGRALQMGTSHQLGQGFARAFKISYLDKSGKKQTPWQNSWGFSTRLIGALVMTHGDDRGLVLPPKLAPNKVVIIPILYKGKEKKVLEKAHKLTSKLNKFGAILDAREEYKPGWKYNEWELKGIPLRIELGPKDIEANQATIVRRDTGKKEIVKESRIGKRVAELLENMQSEMLAKQEKFLKTQTIRSKNMQELKKAIQQKKLVKANWCGSKKCEEAIDKAGAKSINMPFKQNPQGNCIACPAKAKHEVYFGKSY